MQRCLAALLLAVLAGCTENYADGERIGLITQFSNAGMLCKTWEGHLNLTQTGMNSSVPFDFSLDAGNPPPDAVRLTIDSASTYGWKVKLRYHEVRNKNITGCRGETDHFVTAIEVLDRDISHMRVPGSVSSATPPETVYVVIVGRSGPRP